MATPKRQTRKKAKSRTPVYFLSLTVENVRCFGPKQTLDLSDGNGRPAQWTIILGNNGVGKTTLLQSCAVHLPPPAIISLLTMEEYVPPSPYSRWLMSKKNEKEKMTISAAFHLGDRLTKTDTLGEILTCTMTERSGIPWFDQTVDDIICFGYGASRRMSETAVLENENGDSTASLFSGDAVLFNAEEWLLQADYSAHVSSPIQKRSEQQRDKVKEILKEILPDVTDLKFIPPSEEKMLPQIRVETPYGWVSIKDLSLGYRTLIAWMVDFARRMFELYPDEPRPLEQPAVVLVDEIDLHLHPKMQRELMSRLSKIFPNTQFIVTAHSPLVVQAATDANIVLLRREGDHVVIDNNPQTIKGWRVDQILTSELFGLESARPPQYDAVLAEREKILAKARLTKKDKARLQEIAAKIGGLPTGETPIDIEAMDIVRRAAERLKKESQRFADDSHK
ncbi:MAG: AAA family ATPase [Acidobacteria bacterium]|nr:AAA family ATPase [Acidobacteriota bacterium]